MQPRTLPPDTGTARTAPIARPAPSVQPTPPATSSTDQLQAPRSFAPPPRKPKRWRKLAIITLVVVFSFAAIAGGLFWWHVRNLRNNPLTVFRDALTSSLSTTQLQANAAGPNGQSQIDYDFSALKNPLVSSQSTVGFYGAPFEIEGYGSAGDTFISYAKFPDSIPSSLSSVTQNAWVRLRNQGVAPVTVSASLNNLADPRYQDFGPLVFGNFPPAQRTRLVNFLIAQHIYDYKLAKVSRNTIDGMSVFVYPASLNVDFLKVFIQSAATIEGFTPADVQTAVTALDAYKNSQVTLYVSASTHRFVRASFEQAGQVTTIDYSDYNNATLLNEPQTNLTWDNFASLQQQIQHQAATHATAAVLDAQRAADLSQLHSYLAKYYIDHSFYPAFADLDDPHWVAANLPGVDPDAFRDPLGNSSQLVTAPKAGSYAYQTLTPGGKTCSNDISAAISQLCATYALTAMLSTGKQYSITSP